MNCSMLRRCALSLGPVLLSAYAFAADSANPSPGTAVAPPTLETIICIRHGEKPSPGVGNLDAQGLNRALALPDLLLARYGKPAFIFAPDPAQDQVPEGPVITSGTTRSLVAYVRPLLTIAPTAIRCDLPINASIGFRHIADLESELEKPAYRNALVFVAWEHLQAMLFMRNEVRDHGGAPESVPDWERFDFDSIYVAQITRDAAGKASVKFRVDHENLNGLSPDFPQPAGKK
jgi:hypothetical protein